MPLRCLDRSRTHPEAGFTLVLVLVALAILSVGLMGMLQIASWHRYDALAFERQTKGELLTHSALDRLASAISDPADDLEARVLASDMPIVLAYGDDEVEVWIEGEAGKINPATTPLPVIERYFANAGVPVAEAREVMRALSSRSGPELDRAARAVFETTMLQHISFAQYREDFSRFNRAGLINPQFASERVLHAVPDLGETQIAAILGKRRTAPGDVQAGSAYLATASGIRFFALAAGFAFPDGARFVRRRVIEIQASGHAVALWEGL